MRTQGVPSATECVDLPECKLDPPQNPVRSNVHEGLALMSFQSLIDDRDRDNLQPYLDAGRVAYDEKDWDALRDNYWDSYYGLYKGNPTIGAYNLLNAYRNGNYEMPYDNYCLEEAARTSLVLLKPCYCSIAKTDSHLVMIFRHERVYVSVLCCPAATIYNKVDDLKEFMDSYVRTYLQIIPRDVGWSGAELSFLLYALKSCSR